MLTSPDSCGLAGLARSIAENAHAGQRYGSEPYASHLAAVVAVLQDAGYDGEKYAVVGWLHDVLEDTVLTPTDLLSMGIPHYAVEAILFCTDSPGRTRAQRKRATYRRWRASCPWMTRVGRAVKLADRIANLEAALRAPIGPREARFAALYAREHAEFRAALHVSGQHEALWVRYDALAGSIR